MLVCSSSLLSLMAINHKGRMSWYMFQDLYDHVRISCYLVSLAITTSVGSVLALALNSLTTIVPVLSITIVSNIGGCIIFQTLAIWENWKSL